MWSRFSEVAAANPYAWLRQARTADEIITTVDDNRMIAYPYNKLLTANMQVDQGAALIMCSAAAATSAGVPRDRWIFPLSGADADDHWFLSHRFDFHSSPAIRLAGATALSLAGAAIDEMTHVDLYSCFPSAVEIAAAELGLPDDDPSRPLTVTGGLTFGGGPGNNYGTHALASMVGTLRADPGSLGLVTGLGWYLTKHSVGIYGTEPRPPARRTAARPTPRRDGVRGCGRVRLGVAPAGRRRPPPVLARRRRPRRGHRGDLLGVGRMGWRSGPRPGGVPHP